MAQNVSVVVTNLADTSTVTAQDWLVATPPDLILTPHIGERWKSQPGSSNYILFDLGALYSIDSAALFGVSRPDTTMPLSFVSLDATSVIRVRISSVDSSGAAGDLYDHSATGEIFEGQVVRALSTPVTGRYVRFDISQSGAAALLVGGASIGLRTHFTYNPAYGMSRQVVDRSSQVEARGGQIFTRPDNYYRVLDMNFEWVATDQQWSLIDQIDTVCGTHANVLAMLDTDSANLARDSIFGLVTELAPVAQPYPDLLSRTLKIKGRL